jgi:hypothetical protein
MKKKQQEKIDSAYKSIEDSMRSLRDVLRDVVSEPKEQAVECQNEDEMAFIYNILGVKDYTPFSQYGDTGVCIALDERRAYSLMYQNIDDYTICSFCIYLKAENLQKKWDALRFEKAEKDYPKGTKCKSSIHATFLVDRLFSLEIFNEGRIKITDCADNVIYYNGKWAEILKPIFNDELGVPIYEGDEVHPVNKNTIEIQPHYFARQYDKPDCDFYHFSTNKSAKQFVEQERERREKVITRNDIMSFVHIFAHEYSGKEFGANNFMDGIENWISKNKSKS